MPPASDAVLDDKPDDSPAGQQPITFAQARLLAGWRSKNSTLLSDRQHSLLRVRREVLLQTGQRSRMESGSEKLMISTQGLSRRAITMIVASFLTLATGVAITAYELDQRIAKAEARVNVLVAALSDGESRLRGTDSVVAANESQAATQRAERADLNSSPSKYIQSLKVSIERRGISNTYCRASSARLQNISHFNVSDLHDVVEYRRSDGSLVGAAPLRIVGTLLAGQTETLAASAGEVTGESSGTLSKVIVQSLTVLGGK